MIDRCAPFLKFLLFGKEKSISYLLVQSLKNVLKTYNGNIIT
jgi:hypothetical protein